MDLESSKSLTKEMKVELMNLIPGYVTTMARYYPPHVSVRRGTRGFVVR